MVGDTDNQLTKYYTETNNIEQFSIDHLSTTSKATNRLEFSQYCKDMMAMSTCQKVAQASLEQNNCPLWHELRYAKISAQITGK